MVFSFQQKKRDGLIEVTLHGNLIGESYGMSLMNTVSEMMEDGSRFFVFDLSDLQHINSSGLGVLITLLTKLRKKEGDLFLVNPSQNVRNLLLITKLNSIFQVFDTFALAAEKMRTS